MQSKKTTMQSITFFLPSIVRLINFWKDFIGFDYNSNKFGLFANFSKHRGENWLILKIKEGEGGIVNYLKHKGGKMFFTQIYDMTRAFIRESLLD